MEEAGRNSSRPPTKRPLPLPLSLSDDDDSDRHPSEERRARFPKGKKPKKGDSASAAAAELDSLMNPEIAAKQRAKRRKLTRQDEPDEVSAAEVRYEDDVNFVDDGIRIEPFNLEQEREEGYFDANGNFVEYQNKNEIKLCITWSRTHGWIVWKWTRDLPEKSRRKQMRKITTMTSRPRKLGK